MRIATWNCQGALDKKIGIVQSLSPDVLIIQEAAKDTDLSGRDGVSHLWATPGASISKGIGVFGFNGWTISHIEPPVEMPWVLPVKATSPDATVDFTLLATWTNKSKGDGRPSYASQVCQMIAAWGPHLDGPAMIAGDFNGSAQGPEIESHLSNVAGLERLGIQSAYHAGNNVDHGHEPDMTLKWIGKGRAEHRYHCDFIFISSHFDVISSEVVPIWDKFAKQPSDHQPVIADLDLVTGASGSR